MKKKVFTRALSVSLTLAMVASVFASLGTVAYAAKKEEEVVIPEPVGVYDFSYNFEELAEKNEGFEVVQNDAAPKLVEDEEMGQVLQLGKAIIDGQEFGSGGNLIADNSQYSTINIANPYVGRKDLQEYEPYEDVKTADFRNVNQPDWEEGITITYWIKSPNGVNSNVVGFNSERFLIQADDWAKHLCTVKFDVEYAQYTDEEREMLQLNESGMVPGNDFYFEYAGYNEDGTPITYMDKPLYTDPSNMGRIYWMNKFYEPGYLKKNDGTYPNSSQDGSYEKHSVAPYLGTTEDDHNAGDSVLRYAWCYSEMWLDATSSFYFENDNKSDTQLNPNHVASYGTTIGCHNGDCFCINSWRNAASLEEAIKEDGAGPSPVTQPDEWHQVTAVIQNDWVLYYLDGEEVEIEDNYSSYGLSGLATATTHEKPWKRFNKGTGSRYGYGNNKYVTYWTFYGNYVATTIMEWLVQDCVNVTIGGGNRNGDGYLMYANTDEIMLKNVVFYDKMLDEDQIEYLYENPDIYDKYNPDNQPDPVGMIGDVDLDGQINANDALAVLKHVAKINVLDGQALDNADVTGEGDVNATDALDILRLVAKIIDGFTRQQ